MDIQWIRTYRPDPDSSDPRPAILGGGYLTSDPAYAIEFAAIALTQHGHVIVQKATWLRDDIDQARHDRARAREAQAAEARP